jgi:hypothetical protein
VAGGHGGEGAEEIHEFLVDVIFPAAKQGGFPGEGATGGDGFALAHVNQG